MTLTSLEEMWYSEVYESDVVVLEDEDEPDDGFFALTVAEVKEITAKASAVIAGAIAMSAASVVGTSISGAFGSVASSGGAGTGGSSATQVGGMRCFQTPDQNVASYPEYY